MKISTNFVRSFQQAVLPAVLALWLVALGFAAVSWWLVADAAALREALPQLRSTLEAMDAGNKLVPDPVQLPSALELAKTNERVAKINAVVQTKGLPTSTLFAELEALLPADVWLTSVHHRAGLGEVMLIASAASADSLSAFLLKLENSPLFEQAMLKRELQTPGKGQARVQFEIQVKVRA